MDKQSQLLRIQVTNASISQMLYAPDTSTNPGYGFIVMFPSATLADQNDKALATGYVCLRANPEAISSFCLSMLNCLLQPFKGYFELDIMGTYEIDNNLATVLADAVSACDIQPTAFIAATGELHLATGVARKKASRKK